MDLVFLSDSLIKRPYEVEILPGISDHSIVSLGLTMNEPRVNSITTSTYRDSNAADDTAILDELDLSYGPYEEDSRQLSVGVGDLGLRFKYIVLKCTARHVP